MISRSRFRGRRCPIYLIDTSVLLCAVNLRVPAHTKCKEVVKRFMQGDEVWHIAPMNILEFIRLSTHPGLCTRTPLFIDEAINVVRQLLACPTLQVLQPGPRHFEIFADLVTRTTGIRGSLVSDAHLAALMIEHDVRKIFTLDERFRIFKDIQVIDPTE